MFLRSVLSFHHTPPGGPTIQLCNIVILMSWLLPTPLSPFKSRYIVWVPGYYCTHLKARGTVWVLLLIVEVLGNSVMPACSGHLTLIIV